MQYTTNFNLKKPEGTDVVNIDDLNYNADIIDTKLGSHNSEIADARGGFDTLRKKLDSYAVNVKDFGAKGDGVADDTAAIQSFLDSLQEGCTAIIPPGIYRTTSSLFLTTNNVTIYAYGATIINETNSRCILAICSPNLPSKDDTGFNSLITSLNYGYEVEGVKIFGLKGQMMANTAGGSNLGFEMTYAKDCHFIDIEISSSNGNGIEMRNSEKCSIEMCKVSGHRNYGIFIFQSKEYQITGNYVKGGMRGIVCKQTYNGDPNTNGIIEYNILEDIESNEYWIVGGDWYEKNLPDPIYVPGHEVVGNITIKNNILKVVEGSYSPCITIGTFADKWKVINNTFINKSNITGHIMTIGLSGNPTDGGTVGSDHIIEGNKFLNINGLSNTIIDIGVNTSIKSNIFSGQTLYIIKINSNSVNTQIDYVNISSNIFDLEVYLDFVNSNGIVCAPIVSNLTIDNNEFKLTPLTNDTKAALSAIYSQADKSNIINNKIIVTRDASVTTHTWTQAMYLAGNGGIITNNRLILDSLQTVYGIDVRATGYEVSNNIIELKSDSPATASRGINAVADLVNIFNTFVGSWQYKIYDSTSAGSANQLGVTNRIIYRSAAPTAGTWAVGDICFNTAPAAGGYIGWVCITAGTPGTWKGFGSIAT